jgi:excisionase family DNA binding protein
MMCPPLHVVVAAIGPRPAQEATPMTNPNISTAAAKTPADRAALLVTVQVACQRLGISRSTLYVLLRAGSIGFVKAGRRTMIPTAELKRFVTPQARMTRVPRRAA